jgi:exodeoxyribonuclease-3
MGGRRLGWKAILAQRGIFDFSTVRIITCNVNGLRAADRKAQKRGYSGVAIYAKKEPANVKPGLGIPEIDAQGRFLQLDYGAFSVVSLYMPSGTMGDEAQQRKYAFMDRFMPRLEEMRRCGREFVICGDWNIAHREIDVKNWKTNQDTTGLRGERNIGWRIDYEVATPDIAKKATKAVIYTKENFSDHAPVVVDYDYAL